MLQVRDLSKSFPGVRALQEVNLQLDGGEVLAVVGENGAGKSTLMKILAGIQHADCGSISIDGNPVQINSVRDAQALGIALIHQELNLCPNLSVGANIFLGREPRKPLRIDTAQIRADSREVLARLGLQVDPDTQLDRLSLGQQQMVEIAKALTAQARILIMDEPTSSLSGRETEALFTVVEKLRAEGVGVIYISHRLGEVARLADRAMVLRDGAVVGVLQRSEIDHATLVQMMVGRDATSLYQHQARSTGAVALQARDVRTAAFPQHAVNLELREGEIVGLAGLVGAGRSELLRTIFGVDPWVGGSLSVHGQELPVHRPHAAVAAGMAFAPENRKEEGLVLEQSVLDNLRLARLSRDGRRLGYIRGREFDPEASKICDQLGIRTTGLDQEIRLLSGGNQQKVVIGKWIATQPRIFLLDEPTRGVDVGAKAEIYRLMDELARNHIAVLFASSELEEIIGLADRVIVMHEGRLAGELARHQLTEEAIMELATNKTGAA